MSATSFTVDSATQITATAPAEAAGTVHVTVTNPGGTSATSGSDQFTYYNTPTVTNISPNVGNTAGGTSVTITGTSFTGATQVQFGTTNATSFTVNSATQITATAPAEAAGTVDVTVTNPGGTSSTSSSDQFTYYNTPTVTNVSPNGGTIAGGTSVTITGTSFTGTTQVQFGATNATSFTVNSATQITATAPAEAAGTVHITVTNPGGTSATSASDQFTYYNTPTVTSVSPNVGNTAGGTSVTITGTSFTGATQVQFGAMSATSFTVNSATQITATAPAETAGTVHVTVTNPGGTSSTSSSDQFTYYNTPTVTSVSPNVGNTAGGTSVTITGTSFTGATQVQFGATNATSFTVNSATQITATAPAEVAGTVHVTVTNPGGTSSTSSSDQFTYYNTPTVTNVSPNGGTIAGGTSVTITGTSFTGATQVQFGATNATSFTVDSATQITATAPAEAAGTVHVTVTNPGGTSSTSSSDQFTYYNTPTVTNVSPNGGTIGGGTSVTITGTSFTGATTVQFGATNATSFTVDSATQITATAPAEAAGTVHVTVTNPGGTSSTSSSDQYTYYNTPTVTNVNPNSGSTMGGNPVIITGTNFTGATSVSFGATTASFSINSPTQITATAPAESAGTVDVTVTNPGGTSSTSPSDIYTYIPAPAITNVNPNYGSISGGNSVVITGGNFTGATDVSFGVNPASFSVDSDTQITATAPAGAQGTIDIRITTPDGTSSVVPADEYIYNTTPTVATLSQTSGSASGGNTIVLTGTDFLGTTEVAFGANPASFTIDSNTQITTVVPPESLAFSKDTVPVTVTTPEGTSQALLYTYLSTSVNPPHKFHGKVYRRHHLHDNKNFTLKTKWRPPTPSTGIAFYRIYEDGKPKYTLDAKQLKFKKHVRSSHHLHKRYKITAIDSSGGESQKKKLKMEQVNK
jgi:hypothetical protein